MDIEVRNDSVVISGYVTSVERWSKPLLANCGGVIQRCIEKIKAGADGTITFVLKGGLNLKESVGVAA